MLEMGRSYAVSLSHRGTHGFQCNTEQEGDTVCGAVSIGLRSVLSREHWEWDLLSALLCVLISTSFTSSAC